MTTLEALVRDWVDYLRVEKGASAHTVSNYRRDVTRYAFDMKSRGKVSVEDISPRDIEDYTMRLASGQVTGTPAAASSVARASVSTTQIYTQVTAAALREVFTLSHPRARGTDASAR